MRMKNLEVNVETGSINIDTKNHSKPFVVVVSDGRARLTELPEHGETKVVTHMGKVKRVRFDEGVDF